MIELTIDNKKIEVEEGATILKAALKNGIKIPNLCYDKRLRPFGGCRLCVVEAEGQGRLLASCSTPAEKGMVIRTNTPNLIKLRQTALELMLIHHPLDCPECDKAGECDLQDVAYECGKTEGRFIRHRKESLSDVRGPLIELTANRCILCGKCVRVCAEHQEKGALGFIGRGFSTVVQPEFGEILQCDYCGQCIDICPTGAILSKPYKFKARAWYLEEKDTICPFCGCGCTLTLGIREGKILRSRGKEDNGVSEGNLCGRGRFGIDYIYSENRLKTPMLRKNGELVPATWEEAMKYIGDGLKSIISSNGASSVGAIGSHRCTNEDNYMLQKFMRNTIGSNNIDSSASFGYGLVEKGWGIAFGKKDHKIDLKSPLGKDVVFILESDISVTHPVFGLNILRAKREGAKLLVADSSETRLAKRSSQWLKIKHGTGIALLNGMTNIIINKGIFDKERVSKLAGFSALEAGLKDYTADKVSKITGITEEELISATETFARAKSRMLALSIGVSENTKGLDTVLAAANLINLMGDSPDSLQVPAEYCNTMGLYKMGARPLKEGDDKAGKGVLDMLYQDSAKALYIMGEDPVVTFPNNLKMIERLKKLDLLIVQDIALTDTAKLAHVVLPASSWAEKDGTFTNAEGVTQKLTKIVDTVDQAIPDWQIIRNLSLMLGKDIGVKSLEDVKREIDSKLQSTGSEQTPGSKTFSPVRYSPSEETDAAYPLNMAVRDVLQHSGSMSTRSKSLDLVVSEDVLDMSEEDAKRFGILDNSHVKLSSRRGMVYLKARVCNTVPNGTVYVSAHFSYGSVNALTGYSSNGKISTDAVKVEAVK